MGEHRHKAPPPPSPAPPALVVYRAVVCEQALINPASRLLTFVNAAEALHVPAAALGQYVPAAAHFGLSGNGDYEIRLVWLAEDGERCPAGDQADKVTLKGRMPFAAPAVRLPKKPGWYRLVLEWRTAVDPLWHYGEFGYAVEIVLAEAVTKAEIDAASKPS